MSNKCLKELTKKDKRRVKKAVNGKWGYRFDYDDQLDWITEQILKCKENGTPANYSCNPLCGRIKKPRVDNQINPKTVVGVCYISNKMVKGVDKELGACISDFPMNSETCLYEKHFKKSRKIFAPVGLELTDKEKVVEGYVKYRRKTIILSATLNKEQKTIESIYVRGVLKDFYIDEEKGELIVDIEALAKKYQKKFKKHVQGLERLFINEMSNLFWRTKKDYGEGAFYKKPGEYKRLQIYP